MPEITSDEPTTAVSRAKQGQTRPKRKSHKPETVKAEVLVRRCDGESKREIAREVGISRGAVDAILDEVDIGRVILEAGLTHKEIVNNHLKPLLQAEKGGLYGGADNATRLRTIKYINELKGVGPRRDSTGPQTGGITVRLELPPGTDEAKLAAIIASRRGGSGRPGLGGPIDEEQDLDNPYKPLSDCASRVQWRAERKGANPGRQPGDRR